MNNVLLFGNNDFSYNKKFMIKLLFSILLLLNCTILFSQDWVYIENVQTGLVMDVQGNVKTKGTTTWPYSLNHTEAQMFVLTSANIPDGFGADARYIKPFARLASSSNLYLSVKIPPMVVSTVETEETGFTKPELSTEPLLIVDDEIKSSNRKILKRYAFTIEDKIEYDTPLIERRFDSNESLGIEPKQIWKIISVPNEPNVYYIQNAHFKEEFVIEPLDFKSGGTLVLSELTGSNLQKWRILKTVPNDPTDVKLTNFKWKRKLHQEWKFWKSHYYYEITGEITWKRNNDISKLSKQRLSVSTEVDNYFEAIYLEANKDTYKFNFPSNKKLETKEHCFNVLAFSKWPSRNIAYSDNICAVPDYPSPSTTPPPKGVSKLLITNCHSSKTESVRLCLYDLTINNGVWQDKGILNNQWQGNNCPSGLPKEIELNDNHVYILKAIDCGNLPPNITEGSCHVLTSPEIQGAENGNGTTLPFQIDGG